MYCKKCGAKIEENNKFCGVCGEPVCSSTQNMEIRNSRMCMGQHNGVMPTKALVTEGIGFLFFVYLLIANSRSNSDYDAEIFLRESGSIFFFVGLVIVVISFFMFKRFKKNNTLQGLGYVGYIASCIALVLLGIIIILSIFMFIMSSIFIM